MIEKRMKETRARLKKMYKVDIYDLRNYDLVMDTTKMTETQVQSAVLKFLKNCQNKKFYK